jgi:hypothetical protein
MAQVAQGTSADVDWLLDYLFSQWETLEEVVGDWAEWERAAQVDFLLDWPVTQSHLVALRDHMRHGDVSPKQRARAVALEALITRLRPVLAKLQAG